MNPTLTVIAGGMFAGKTEELIRKLKRFTYAKKRTCIYKPSIDNRYHSHKIVSHNGANLACIPVREGDLSMLFASIKENPENFNVLGFDEAQFFSEVIIDIVKYCLSRNISVIVAGLDKDYKGEPFGSMPHLMALADEVIKLKAICMVCGQDACMSQRLKENKPATEGSVILVGTSETYEARCRSCYVLPD